MYKNPKCCIKNNGWISEPVCIERGIRQGCPALALLFVISIEMLAQSFRLSQKVNGITLDKATAQCLKINQYADDCVLYVDANNNGNFG